MIARNLGVKGAQRPSRSRIHAPIFQRDPLRPRALSATASERGGSARPSRRVSRERSERPSRRVSRERSARPPQAASTERDPLGAWRLSATPSARQAGSTQRDALGAAGDPPCAADHSEWSTHCRSGSEGIRLTQCSSASTAEAAVHRRSLRRSGLGCQ